MRIVDLFCGSGGFSHGIHSAGHEVVAAYDIDPILTSSFACNFPGTNLHLRNVARLSGLRVLRDAGGPVDGIVGGPPCQGFSEIGRRAKTDPRRRLLRHFFRIVSEIEPRFFVMENVRGLGFADTRHALDDAIAVLGGAYDVLGPCVWDAADFGAATTRRRLFVVGIRHDLKRPLSEEMILAQKRPAATVRQAISDLAGATSLGNDEGGFDLWKIGKAGRPNAYAAQLRGSGYLTGQRLTPHAPEIAARFEKVVPGKRDEIGRHPRLRWDGQCPTLRAGTGSDKGSYQAVRPLHPDEPRVITVREAARLQGFPDSHRFHPTVWHSFRMIGNSVSPFIARAVLTAIEKRLDGVADVDRRKQREAEPMHAGY